MTGFWSRCYAPFRTCNGRVRSSSGASPLGGAIGYFSGTFTETGWPFRRPGARSAPLRRDERGLRGQGGADLHHPDVLM